MKANYKFVVGEKYSVKYNDGRTNTFRFIGGPIPMVSFEDDSESFVELDRAICNCEDIVKL